MKVYKNVMLIQTIPQKKMPKMQRMELSHRQFRTSQIENQTPKHQGPQQWVKNFTKATKKNHFCWAHIQLEHWDVAVILCINYRVEFCWAHQMGQSTTPLSGISWLMNMIGVQTQIFWEHSLDTLLMSALNQCNLRTGEWGASKFW